MVVLMVLLKVGVTEFFQSLCAYHPVLVMLYGWVGEVGNSPGRPCESSLVCRVHNSLCTLSGYCGAACANHSHVLDSLTHCYDAVLYE